MLSTTDIFATKHMKAVRAKQPHLDRIDPANWIMEEKYKGIRIWRNQYSDGTVQILTYGGEDITSNFPHLTIPLTRPCIASQIDGELFDPDQEDEVVSGWANRDYINPDTVANCVLKAFDLLHLDQFYLGKLPLIKRKELLKSLKPFGGIHLVKFQPAFGHELFYEEIVAREGEGIVLKNINQSYLEGSRRVDFWLKRKKRDPYDCVVLGFTKAKPGKFFGLIGAVTVGQYIGGSLRPICNVSGMSNEVRKSMTDFPEFYLGKACAIWAMEQDVNSKALIEPSWKGLHTEKNPEDCVCEDEFENLDEKMVDF